jgi:pyruvate/2-oxoglutarate dehydrogenase complex dihydrolipoamide dehydrogenase (E3) component
MNRMESTSAAHLVKMTQPEEFDLVILGGGTGSTVAAWTFAGEGNRVAVVDRKYIGGSCPNVACLPSKNIIHSAKLRLLSPKQGVWDHSRRFHGSYARRP